MRVLVLVMLLFFPVVVLMRVVITMMCYLSPHFSSETASFHNNAKISYGSTADICRHRNYAS